MAEATKPLTITLLVNILLVTVGGVTLLDGGLVTYFVDVDTDRKTVEASDQLKEDIPEQADTRSTGVVGSIIDFGGMTLSLLITVFNTLTAPIALFAQAQIPWLVTLIVGTPLLLVNIITWTQFLRSAT
jgi:hypothetical protein